MYKVLYCNCIYILVIVQFGWSDTLLSGKVKMLIPEVWEKDYVMGIGQGIGPHDMFCNVKAIIYIMGMKECGFVQTYKLICINSNQMYADSGITWLCHHV